VIRYKIVLEDLALAARRDKQSPMVKSGPG
jgi:hypothetical protein